MDSKHRCLSIVASFLTFLQNVEESLGEAYACDSPYIDNGRPVNVPAEVYRTYCCKAKKYSDGYSFSRFSCATEGGCCGETDSQYCCDRSGDTISLKLGLGIAAGFIGLIALIIILICCCVKKKCACCKPLDWDTTRYPDSPWSMHSRDALDGIRTRENTPNTTSYYQSQNTERLCDSRLSQFTLQSHEHEVPTAPPISNPNLELDLFPPSYEEVVQNPEVYPGTDTPKIKQ